MNATQIQAVIVSASALTSGVKGIKTATVWGDAIKAGLVDYPIVQQQINSWLACGASVKTTSGVAYKAVHNKGVFPVEQIYCNSKAKAKRPIAQIGMAVAQCLINGTDYNPDRFADAVTKAGLEQGLKQMNRTVESLEKKAIYTAINAQPVTKKIQAELVKTSQEMSQARDKGLGAKAFQCSQDIAMLLAASAKRNMAKPAAPAVTKPVQTAPEVVKPAKRKGKGKAA